MEDWEGVEQEGKRRGRRIEKVNYMRKIGKDQDESVIGERLKRMENWEGLLQEGDWKR